MNDPSKVLFRGHKVNIPPVKAEWSKERCWLEGYYKAMKTFKRDLRKGRERKAGKPAHIAWSGDK